MLLQVLLITLLRGKDVILVEPCIVCSNTTIFPCTEQETRTKGARKDRMLRIQLSVGFWNIMNSFIFDGIKKQPCEHIYLFDSIDVTIGALIEIKL